MSVSELKVHHPKKHLQTSHLTWCRKSSVSRLMFGNLWVMRLEKCKKSKAVFKNFHFAIKFRKTYSSNMYLKFDRTEMKRAIRTWQKWQLWVCKKSKKRKRGPVKKNMYKLRTKTCSSNSMRLTYWMIRAAWMKQVCNNCHCDHAKVTLRTSKSEKNVKWKQLEFKGILEMTRTVNQVLTLTSWATHQKQNLSRTSTDLSSDLTITWKLKRSLNRYSRRCIWWSGCSKSARLWRW